MTRCGSGPAARWENDELVLLVRVQPRASRDQIVGVEADRLKVRITAAPVDGQANAQLLKLLAKAFGVAKSAIIIETGETARDKRVRIRAPRRLLADRPPGP